MQSGFHQAKTMPIEHENIRGPAITHPTNRQKNPTKDTIESVDAFGKDIMDTPFHVVFDRPEFGCLHLQTHPSNRASLS